MFNLLAKTLTCSIDDASEAAVLLIKSVTVDNAYSIKSAAQSLGLGIDAEIDDGQEPSYSKYFDNTQMFAEAWKGGPQSTIEGNCDISTDDADNVSDAIRRAQQLLASDPKLRYMVSIAQSNPKVREAVEACMGDRQ